NVLFSIGWGIVLKEWTGAGRRTIAVLVAGMCLLILSLLLPNLL
ncbi:MAG: rhamnose/proton symporter RhaT, partial [Tannerellaceae bacterium]